MKRQGDLPQDNLARNLRFLMDKNEHSAAYLAERLKGKVSRSTLHYILNREKVARVDTVDYIASVYGLSGWHLISPSLISDIEQSPTLSKLIRDYTHATPEGQKLIEQVAEREAEYVAKSGK